MPRAPSPRPSRIVSAAQKVEEFIKGISWRRAFFGACGVILLLLAVGGGAYPDKGAGLFQFFLESLGFLGQILIIILIALLSNWVVQFVRTRRWYDLFAAARELLIVQKRVGTPDEKPGDNQTLGRQYFANTILLSVIILAYFLLHD